MERTRSIGLDWGEWWDSGVGVGFILLAYGAAFNVSVYEVGKTWPPEFSSDKLLGLEITRVSGSFMVMTLGKDRVMEGVIQGNVDMTFVCEDVVIILPVGELRSEGGRDILQR